MRWIIALAIAALVVGGGVYAVRSPGGGGTPDGGVNVDGAVRALEGVVAEGVVVPVRFTTLGTATGGRVQDVLVEEGAHVEAGQVLLRLDGRELQARLDNARAELSRAMANLRQLRSGARAEELAIKNAQVEQARIEEQRASDELKRTEALLKKNVISPQDVEKVRSAAERARVSRELAEADLALLKAGARPEAVAVAEAGVAAARAAVQQVEIASQQMQLTAPFRGDVAWLEARPGEVVAPGTPLVRIADTSAFEVRTEDLTELAVTQVSPGAMVKLTFDAIPDLELPGRVAHIRSFGERKKGDMTYTVVIEPLSQDPRLRWNMTASVQIAPPGDGGVVEQTMR